MDPHPTEPLKNTSKMPRNYQGLTKKLPECTRKIPRSYKETSRKLLANSYAGLSLRENSMSGYS